MAIRSRLQAAVDFTAKAAVGVAGSSVIFAYALNENSWLHWEVDRVSKQWDADQIHIYDLELLIKTLRTQIQGLKAALGTHQAVNSSLKRQLAVSRRARKMDKVRDTKKIACLRQLLCSVQHELAMAGKSARQGASWLHQQQQRIDEDMAAMQAANSSLQAGIASLTANGRWRDSEMEDLESNVSNQTATAGRAVDAKQASSKAGTPELLGTPVQTKIPQTVSTAPLLSLASSQEAQQCPSTPVQHHAKMSHPRHNGTAAQESSGHGVESSVVQAEVSAAQYDHKQNTHDAVLQPRVEHHTHRQTLQLLKDLRSQHHELTAQHEQLGAKHEELSIENEQLKTEHTQLSSEREQLSEQRKELQSRHEHLTAQHTTLQKSHSALLHDHKQLVSAQAAKLEALTHQHAELQRDHRTNEQELWELADAHADLNKVHDACLVELGDSHRQLGMLQKAFKRLSSDRLHVQNQLCSTGADLHAARGDVSAVKLDMQKLQNTCVCLLSQREGVSLSLDHLSEVHHALGHKYAEAVDIRDEAVACAARLREELTKAKDQCNDAEVHSSSLQQELSEARDQRDEARGRESSSQEGLNEAVKQIATMQQNLAAIMASQKSPTSLEHEEHHSDEGLIKAIPGKSEHRNLGRTDSAIDNPGPRLRK